MKSTLLKTAVCSLALSFATAANGQSADPMSRELQAWHENAADVCTAYGWQAPSVEQGAYIVNTLSQSRHGKLLLDYALSQNTSICFDPTEQGRAGYYDFTANALVLSDDPITLKTVKTSAHELRHKWQMDNGYGASTEYAPVDRALIGKAMEADAEAFANLVMYELEEKGFDVHSALPGHYDYWHVYHSFRAAVEEKSPNSTGSLHQATRQAFDAWYDLPIAATHYEYSYLSGFESFIDDPRVMNHYPVSYGNKTVSNEKLHELGDMLDGSNYFTATQGIAVTDARYRAPLSEENAAVLARLDIRIPEKQREFCATRPQEEQRFCNPYPVRPSP